MNTRNGAKVSSDPDWSDEEYILSLPADENDKFERKGTRSLDLTVAGVKDGEVRAELAKQLSAFANTGGGRIIYGLANDGSVEMGGVSQSIRGRQSTKDWLENVIAQLTDPEIIGVRVIPVLPKNSERSKIEPGKALYVIEVPDSDRAPHQSVSDRRYYVRIGSKSEPTPHRLIEDIRNRAKHPNVEVIVDTGDFEVFGREVPPSDSKIRIPFQISIRNVGVLKSQNTCLHFQLDLSPPCFIPSEAKG